MNRTPKTHSSEHQEVTMLLPWYVNKTLNSEEKNCVEAHLKNCLVCKIELTNLQKLSASICQEDILVPVAHASFLELKNRIHNNEVSLKQKTGIFESLLAYRERFANLTEKNLVPLYPSLVLACLLLLTVSLISPAFFVAKQYSAKTFHTLSSSQRTTHQQNEIRLVFSNEITQEQIMQILASVQGQIVGGPTPQGVFRVRIGKGKITSKDLIKTVSLLRDNMQVIFAEPTFVSAPPNNQSPG
jgi:hypothetical protein